MHLQGQYLSSQILHCTTNSVEVLIIIHYYTNARFAYVHTIQCQCTIPSPKDLTQPSPKLAPDRSRDHFIKVHLVNLLPPTIQIRINSLNKRLSKH